MKKGINADKIIKYAGTTAVVFALCVGAGITIDDACVDHTQEVCRLGQIMSSTIELQNGMKITYGMIHQMREMQKEYEEKGINVTMAYEPFYEEVRYIDATQRVLPVETILEDGTVEYSLPEGYELKLIDGKYYGVKTILVPVTECYEAYVAYDKDEENDFTGKSYVLRIK